MSDPTGRPDGAPTARVVVPGEAAMGGTTTPQAKPSDLTPHQQLGGEFGRRLIWLLVVVCVLVLLAWTVLEGLRGWQLHLAGCDLPKSVDAVQLSGCTEYIKQVAALYADQRKDLISLSQIVLINLLLPLLTAVFGYTFGRERGREDADK